MPAVSPAPTLIAQISDLHIKRPGQLAYGKVDTAAALARLVASLNAFKPRPALVVVTGDLVDGGSAEEYAHLRALLAPLAMPMMVMPGNHDGRDAMRAAFTDQPFAAGRLLNQHRAIGDLDLYGLDSAVTGAPHGELEPDTLAWLDGELARDRERPALVFLHHPPFKAGIWHMDRQNLANANALAELVRRHPRVRLVAAGHVHRAVSTSFAGTMATICPAANHAVALDLDAHLGPSFQVEPPAFHLHAWFPQAASLVTHVVPVGDHDGPHPFFDAEGRLL